MKVGVTGANGFVGSRIVSSLLTHGHDVVRLVRVPTTKGDRAYALGQPCPSHLIDDLDALVHAAWDFTAIGKAMVAINRDGSQPLLEATSNMGVRLVLISTMSAFDGCRSSYGRAKLDLERRVADQGGASIRAGVVFGFDAGGIFGSLRVAIDQGSVIPVFSGGHQPLSVTWDTALGELVEYLIRVPVLPVRPVLAAHPAVLTLRSLVDELATVKDRRPRVISVNWRLVWLGLRFLEAIGCRPSFRSDSLLALANPIPASHRAALAPSPIVFPPISRDLWDSKDL